MTRHMNNSNQISQIRSKLLFKCAVIVMNANEKIQNRDNISRNANLIRIISELLTAKFGP